MQSSGILSSSQKRFAMPTDEELLLSFYAGQDGALLELFARYSSPLDQFLRTCVRDQAVVVAIWQAWMQLVRQSRRHPELHFDLRRGPAKGYLFSVAGHLAYMWLVELRMPGDFF